MPAAPTLLATREALDAPPTPRPHPRPQQTGRQAHHFFTNTDPGGVAVAAHIIAPTHRKARLPTLEEGNSLSPNQHFLCNNLRI